MTKYDQILPNMKTLMTKIWDQNVHSEYQKSATIFLGSEMTPPSPRNSSILEITGLPKICIVLVVHQLMDLYFSRWPRKKYYIWLTDYKFSHFFVWRWTMSDPCKNLSLNSFLPRPPCLTCPPTLALSWPLLPARSHWSQQALSLAEQPHVGSHRDSGQLRYTLAVRWRSGGGCLCKPSLKNVGKRWFRWQQCQEWFKFSGEVSDGKCAESCW